MAETLEDVKKEIDELLAIFREANPGDLVANLQTHLADNLLPMISSLVEAIEKKDLEVAEALDGMDEALDMLTEGDAEKLSPESAAQIGGLLEVGRSIAMTLKELLPKLPDTARKSATKQIQLYLTGMQAVTQLLAELTLEPDDEPADDGEPADEAPPEAPPPPPTPITTGA